MSGVSILAEFTASMAGSMITIVALRLGLEFHLDRLWYIDRADVQCSYCWFGPGIWHTADRRGFDRS